jgi:hypothetical protein
MRASSPGIERSVGMEGVVAAFRLMGATAGVMALLCATTAAQNAHFEVCVGSGGGPSCISKTTIYYTCSQYREIGGGSASTVQLLGQRLCGERLQPKVTVKFDVGGGECGWTLFEVTCSDVATQP